MSFGSWAKETAVVQRVLRGGARMTVFASLFLCAGINTSRRPAVLLYRTPHCILRGELRQSLMLADERRLSVGCQQAEKPY